ncbi:MAG TPA: nucleotidyltransferase [Lachnoclostridium sp.]|nr:nucleotidyltransferase [Lachnoclostridium sp.]
MKTAGIIAEYNPFHNGHHYQIQELRRLTGADYVVVAMSGDFVQRGEPAIFDKYTRTRMALCGGADLVVELPVLFATSSAEDFSSCGVALLEKLGVDLLCFGSESGDLKKLQKAAEILVKEPEAWKIRLKEHLKKGETYPTARSLATTEYTKDPELAALLSSPNNILAIEYLKALKKRSSPVTPVTIQRQGAGYHDTRLEQEESFRSVSENKFFASASAIRSLIQNNGFDSDTITEKLRSQIPSDALSALISEGALDPPVFPDDLTTLLNFRLLSLTQEQKGFSTFSDLSPELASRLAKQTLQFASCTERIDHLKTKGYTYTRISRALLHLLLGITSEQVFHARSLDYAPYARILGFQKSSALLLSHLREKSQIPLITKTADAGKLLTPDALDILETDFFASHLYQAILAGKGRHIRNEYTKSVIIV